MNLTYLHDSLDLIKAQAIRFRQKENPDLRCHLIRDLEVIGALVENAREELKKDLEAIPEEKLPISIKVEFPCYSCGKIISCSTPEDENARQLAFCCRLLRETILWGMNFVGDPMIATIMINADNLLEKQNIPDSDMKQIKEMIANWRKVRADHPST